ncbi:hypothetical protein F0L68_35720 [Solihabitans fulvus]|uniref:HTH merR-type domain-containing protein n=1 Tax=Solihabitans fulvus TaxID=1892852 RepID=A0A5B2WPQ9_9PSEU|nr:hypothetical protein F0L68_35720 [Solihabitans fulvus]
MRTLHHYDRIGLVRPGSRSLGSAVGGLSGRGRGSRGCAYRARSSPLAPSTGS